MGAFAGVLGDSFRTCRKVPENALESTPMPSFDRVQQIEIETRPRTHPAGIQIVGMRGVSVRGRKVAEAGIFAFEIVIAVRFGIDAGVLRQSLLRFGQRPRASLSKRFGHRVRFD